MILILENYVPRVDGILITLDREMLSAVARTRQFKGGSPEEPDEGKPRVSFCKGVRNGPGENF